MSLNYHALPVEVESVSNVTLTNSVDLGTERVFNGERYVYVYNDSNTSMPVGLGCVMSGNTGMSVTISSTTYFNYCVGFVKHATMPSLTYGWLLTKGFTNVKMDASSSGIVGAPLYLGLSGVVAGIPAANTLSTAFSQLTSLYGIQAVGVCVQATASAGTGYAYVNVYGA